MTDFDATAARFNEDGKQPLTAAVLVERGIKHLKLDPNACAAGVLGALADIEAGNVACKDAGELGTLCERAARQIEWASAQAVTLIHQGKLERIAKTMQADLEFDLECVGEAAEQIPWWRGQLAYWRDLATQRAEASQVLSELRDKADAAAREWANKAQEPYGWGFLRRLKFAVTGK